MSTVIDFDNARKTQPERSSLRVVALTKFKQGDIWEGLQRRGWTQKRLAEEMKMDVSRLGNLINLRTPKRIELTNHQQSVLLNLTGKLPEELWPHWCRGQKAQELVRLAEVNERDALTASHLLLPPAQEQGLLHADEREQIREALIVCTLFKPRDREIIKLRYGLDDSGDGMTYKALGEKFGITTERVRQILFRVEEKLRPLLREMLS